MSFLSAETRAFALICSMAAVGCSAPVVDDPADAVGSTTEAILLVERVATADGTTQTNVSAKFMRLAPATDPELAERVIGSRLDLPPSGECMLISSAVQNDAQGAAALGSVELLDVGDLVLKTGETSMSLAARAFPDAFGLVSGVVYTSRDAASDLPVPAKYELLGSGSASVERFGVMVEAPAALADVQVGDQALLDGLVLDARDSVRLRWSADVAGSKSPSGAEDLVYADLTVASGSALRCAFADEGRGEIPAALLKSPAMGELPAQATLALHRVRLGNFNGAGVDVGEARFDLSTVGRVTVIAE